MMKITTLLILAMHGIPASAGDSKLETPDQVRRIMAQSICLATAYPGTALATDSDAVYAVYATMLQVKSPLDARRKVAELAASSAPATPTPVGNYNLALAKCTLFAERRDVRAALGERRAKTK
jgi:hypothetical protein